MSNASNTSSASNNNPKKTNHVEYQQRIAPIKNEILNLGERNMENTIRVIRRWLNDDTRIINQYILDKYGKEINYPKE